MSGIEKTSSNKGLQSNAVQGGVSIAAGIAFSILNNIAQIPFIGLLAGVGMAWFGYRMIKNNKTRASFVQGAVITAGGILCAITGSHLPIIGHLGKFALGSASFGLVLYGAWKLFTYWRESTRKS